MAILGLAFFLALLLLAGAGKLLIPIFPVGAFAVGVFLYRRTPNLYVGFTWWMWFIGPLIRRIIDYQSGRLTPGPWILVPLLVTLISFATLARHLPSSYKRDGLPFILCVGSVFYGFFAGVIQNKLNVAFLDLLGWLTPILFSFNLFIHWREYPSYRQTTQRTFLWGVLVMGAYGIWQYLVAPGWDRFWLKNITATSFGIPEPLGIRVSSSMDAPQPFATAMMAGLLLLFSNQGNLRFVAAGFGYLAFLLSSARTAWLSWLLGLLIFFPSLKARLQMQLIISIMVAAVLVVPLMTVEPFSTAIAPRLESLSNTKKDASYQDRAKGYSELLNLAVVEYLGRGFGSVVESGTLGSRDSGILSLLFSLGWFGTVPYLGGMLLLFFKMFQCSTGRSDTFLSAARAITLCTFAQISLNVVTVESIGMVLWGFLGISVAAQKYYWHQNMMKTVTCDESPGQFFQSLNPDPETKYIEEGVR
jgi:hypothetical protein